MGSGGASLILICEGSEEGVVKRMDAEGLMVLKMTRMGSLSGAWTMKMRRWALLMPPGPSYLSRRAPRNLFLRSKSLISRAWRKRRRNLQKGQMKRGLRQVSP
ncbi:hypothetical protein LEMLEM_LOCUS20781 [Lemmus lemmus]